MHGTTLSVHHLHNMNSCMPIQLYIYNCAYTIVHMQLCIQSPVAETIYVCTAMIEVLLQFNAGKLLSMCLFCLLNFISDMIIRS